MKFRIGYLIFAVVVVLATLLALVAYFFTNTTEKVSARLAYLESVAEGDAVRASGMAFALQESQNAALALVAERYRTRAEVTHESEEWGAGENIDLDAVDDAVEDFEDYLAESWTALNSIGNAERRAQVQDSGHAVSDHLREIESEFAAYEEKLDRFVHLAKRHPSDQVEEHLRDVLRPHYQETMLPLIRSYEREVLARVSSEATSIRDQLARGNRRNRRLAWLAFVGAVLFGIWVTRAISRPLKSLRVAAEEVGRGNLDVLVQVRSNSEFGLLAETFRAMMSNLRETTVSRRHLDNIVQSIADLLIVTDGDGNIVNANRAAIHDLGFEESELLGSGIDSVFPEDASIPEQGARVETEMLCADGGRMPVAMSVSSLSTSSAARVFVARDIRERLEAEDNLTRSLEEKEILLKEVHHRVKNNLQIISSLLELQTEEIKNSVQVRELRESQNRIRSMALMHELLYQSEDMTSVDIGQYLKLLAHQVVGSYGGNDDRKINIRVEAETSNLGIDAAVPCGMIVNELVANSVEHAFSKSGGVVQIEFTPHQGGYRLQVQDDGVGLPDDFDVEATTSLGLKLIVALSEQLGGKAHFDGQDGTRFRLDFGVQG